MPEVPPPPTPLPPPVPQKKGMSTGCIVALAVGIGAAILGVLMVVLVSGTSAVIRQRGSLLEKRQEAQLELAFMTLGVGLEAYKLRAGNFPTAEQSLDALVNKPTQAPVPDEWSRLMDELPTDPWDQPYRYRQPAQKSKRHFDLWSIGRDGVDGTSDDVGNWSKPAAK